MISWVTLGSAFSLIVTAAVVWGIKIKQTPSFTPDFSDSLLDGVSDVYEIGSPGTLHLKRLDHCRIRSFQKQFGRNLFSYHIP